MGEFLIVVVFVRGCFANIAAPHIRILSSSIPLALPSRYKSDLFGLQTVDKAGKILFNTTEGNHLQFSQEQLKGWVDYFV